MVMARDPPPGRKRSRPWRASVPLATWGPGVGKWLSSALMTMTLSSGSLAYLLSNIALFLQTSQGFSISLNCKAELMRVNLTDNSDIVCHPFLIQFFKRQQFLIS